MKKFFLFALIFLIFMFSIAFLIENSTKDFSVLEAANENPEAEYFLKAYPEAKIQGYIISKDKVEEEIEKIRKSCGESFEEKDYWKFEYSNRKDNKTLSVWIEPETGHVSCINMDKLVQDVRIPFGIKQGKEEVKIKRGRELNEKIYLYNVNGEDEYFVKLDVLEKPPWILEVNPPTRLYKPLNKDSIEMNVKLEPSEIKLFKQKDEEYEYIEIKGIEGFVKSKPINLRMETPKPAPFKSYEEEKFNLKLNLTLSYFRGMRSFYHSSHLLNYTIILEKN